MQIQVKIATIHNPKLANTRGLNSARINLRMYDLDKNIYFMIFMNYFTKKSN